ncbi:hypothetical protein N9S69_04785, partial [Flavobacteriaceae bacterium]|nr:hypothetical protein [Flavobacteriaceae bacterium]
MFENKITNSIVFIKAGNSLRDYIDMANDSSQYHYHLSEILKSLNINFLKYIYCFGDYNANKAIDNLEFIIVKNKTKSNLFKPIKRIVLLIKLLKFLIKIRPKFIISNSANEFIFGAFIYKIFFGCNLISSSHGAIDDKSNKIFRMLNIFILNRVDFLIVHGPYLHESLKIKLDKAQFNKMLVYDIPCVDLYNL